MFKKGMYILVLSFLYMMRCYGAEAPFRHMAQNNFGKDTLHTYEHSKTGLEVIWIANDDIRKSFVLGVKTPAEDNTGVNHIIEHTVFTGSKNYPSPRLFFDASSAYPHLFMNAMTSGDMTLYPFTTPYMSCYKNLLKIYLDSIFYPNMLNDPSGFYEESFHFNPDTGAFGGVVYNEMKGAYTSVDRVIYRSIRETVYQGTLYANDSGGDPSDIPKLTYEQFVKTYHNYYYPSNMKIILYGDLPIDDILDTIDNYLSDQNNDKEALRLEADIHYETPYIQHAVMPEGEKPCLIKSFVIPKKLTAKQMAELDIWVSAYLLSPNSQFQKEMQKAGFANIKISKDEDLPYPIYSIIVQDIPYLKIALYNTLIDNILSSLKEDFKSNAMIEEDAINQAKLELIREDQSTERGIEIAQSILDEWAHKREPHQYYMIKQHLNRMTKLPKDCAQLLLKESYLYTIELLPGRQTIASPLSVMAVKKENWQKIMSHMAAWQTQKTALEPVNLSDFKITDEKDIHIRAQENKAYVMTKVPKGLARSQLYYNTSHIKQKDLPYLFLYAYLLEESAKELLPFRGVLEASCIAYNNAEGYSPFLKISIVSGEKETNHGELFMQARQNLLNKDYTWYKHKLTKFTANFKEKWSANVLNALSSLNMGAEKGAKRYLYEQGYPLYALSEDFIKNKKNDWISLVKKMDTYLYNQNGLVVATANPKKYTNPYEASWKKIIKSQPQIEVTEPMYQFEAQPQKSFLVNDTQVDYIYLQYTQPDKYLDGIDYLSAVYLTQNYLNPQIRIKLGAYGAGCQVGLLESIAIFTYRDPNYKISLDILNAIPEYLENNISETLIEASKIEALSRVHSQFKLIGSPMEKAEMSERCLLMGIPSDYIVNLQQQIVEARREDMMHKASLFKVILEKGALGVATNSQKEIAKNHKIYHFR